MSQFRKADSSVYSVFLEMIEKIFPEVSGYSFGILFRETMKKSRGRITVAEICLPTKLLSYFARNDDGNPFDFLMIVDEMSWACARDEDRIRIIRHELRHVHITDKGVPKLVDHDFQDFHEEVELNNDDPSWCSKLVEITLAGYKQVKEGQPDPRVDHQSNDDVKPVIKSPQRQTHLPESFTNKVAKQVVDKIVEDAKISHKNVDEIVEDSIDNDDEIVNDDDKNVENVDESSKTTKHESDDDWMTQDEKASPSMKLNDLARKKGLLPVEA